MLKVKTVAYALLVARIMPFSSPHHDQEIPLLLLITMFSTSQIIRESAIVTKNNHLQSYLNEVSKGDWGDCQCRCVAFL